MCLFLSVAIINQYNYLSVAIIKLDVVTELQIPPCFELIYQFLTCRTDLVCGQPLGYTSSCYNQKQSSTEKLNLPYVEALCENM